VAGYLLYCPSRVKPELFVIRFSPEEDIHKVIAGWLQNGLLAHIGYVEGKVVPELGGNFPRGVVKGPASVVHEQQNARLPRAR